MFHVKRFGPIGAKYLTKPKTAFPFDLVRSIDLLKQFWMGGGTVSIERPVARRWPRCQFRLNRPAVKAGIFCTGIMHQEIPVISMAKIDGACVGPMGDRCWFSRQAALVTYAAMFKQPAVDWLPFVAAVFEHEEI
jgi:hypothetical protein